MNKSKILLTLGVWVAILPYLGFPFIFKNILFTLTGLVLVYLSYILYRESKMSGRGDKAVDSFRDNEKYPSKKRTLESKPEPELEKDFLEEIN